MVKGQTQRDKRVYICEECGLGYLDRETALECEKWCSTYKSCNIEITRKAVHRGNLNDSL